MGHPWGWLSLMEVVVLLFKCWEERRDGRGGRELFVSVAGKIKTKMFRLKREHKR